MTTIQAPYRDATLPIEQRVADLLARMTIEEKIAQLGSIWSFEIVGIGTLNRDHAQAPGGQRHRPDHPAGRGDEPRAPATWRRWPTRSSASWSRRPASGIPAIIHEESLHGLVSRDAPCFQQSIGAAASWDPPLVERMASTLRRRMLATGARQSLAPVLDVTRDPRWGRIEETYGEDPYLAAELGCAYVRGMQGERLSEGVIATGKHMVGHGLAEGGLNQAPVHLGTRARCATSSCSRSRPPYGMPGSPASCRPTATSTACRVMPRTSC